MRRNSKMTKRMSRVASLSCHCGAVLVVLFVMVILNLLASSSCQRHAKVIGEQERQICRLDDSIRQESTRWEQMKTPEKLEMALIHHGLKMAPARPSQNIHMKTDGTPYGYFAAKLSGKVDSVASNVKPGRRKVR